MIILVTNLREIAVSAADKIWQGGKQLTISNCTHDMYPQVAVIEGFLKVFQ